MNTKETNTERNTPSLQDEDELIERIADVVHPMMKGFSAERVETIMRLAGRRILFKTIL